MAIIAPVKRGRMCPVCFTMADEGDSFCQSADHDFTAADPTVGIDGEGNIVEVNGKPIPPTAPATYFKSGASTATVAAPRPAAPPAPPPTPAAPVPPPPPPVVEPVADETATAVSGKKCWIEIAIDTTTPRDGRPAAGEDGYADPPAELTVSIGKSIQALPVNNGVVSIELTKPLVPFGRANLLLDDNFIRLPNDNVVAKLHGFLRRTADGGYELENKSEKSGTFVRGFKLLEEKDERAPLADNTQLEVGDWYTITYREEAVA